jgi:hypothetical protein
MFNLHQQILLINEEEGWGKSVAISSLDNLSQDLVAMCEKHNVYNIKLQGNSEYANGLVEDIYTIAKTNFGLNNIKVEVI